MKEKRITCLQHTRNQVGDFLKKIKKGFFCGFFSFTLCSWWFLHHIFSCNKPQELLLITHAQQRRQRFSLNTKDYAKKTKLKSNPIKQK